MRVVFAAIALAGCSRAVSLIGSEVDPDGGDGSDAGTADVGLVDGCRENIGDPIGFRVEAPAVVVALDRSFSMLSRLGSTTRLQAAQMALRTVLRSYQGGVQFGYEEFPVRCDGPSCCAGKVVVPPALNSLMAIEKQMRCEMPASGCFETTQDAPTAEALAQCRAFYAATDQPASGRFVLVVTDGEPSCGSDRASACERAVAEAARLATAGVKTAVVAMGDNVKSGGCLEMLGRYAWASDEPQLRQWIQEAVAMAAGRSCRITLKTVAPNPERLALLVKGDFVPRDATQGWSFDPPGQPLSIAINGTLCERLRAGQVDFNDLRVVPTACR